MKGREGGFLDKLSKYQLQTKRYSIQLFCYLYNFNVKHSSNFHVSSTVRFDSLTQKIFIN